MGRRPRGLIHMIRDALEILRDAIAIFLFEMMLLFFAGMYVGII